MTAIDPAQPVFRTRHIATAIGCSTQFVRDQVKAGKLRASFRQKGSSYTTYRFSLNDVVAYNPDAAERLRGTFHVQQASEATEASEASEG